MSEQQLSSDEVRVELIDFNDFRQTEGWAFEFANYDKGSHAKGLKVYGCECGAHCFALAWDDAMERRVSHQTSPLRKWIEEKGIKPEKPAPSPHIVLIDHEDASILTQRRWRPLPTLRGYRAKYFLKSGTRSHAVQRFIHPSAECIEFLNGNGLDLRRCNLRRTTLKVLLRERNRRRGWAAKKGLRKRVVRKAA